MRRLAAGVVLVLLAACGDGAPPQAVRDSAGQEATTTSTLAAATSSTTVAGTGRTSTTIRTTTTRAGAATTSTAPAGPRALTPATPGTYRYDTAGATTFAGNNVPFPAVTTLVVDAPSGTRQRVTRNLRDAAGSGVATEFTLDYRPD
ncbi:MAG TPA: hypothetical protein VJ653_06940, partial [Acidimicrobiales bacterium]|nr:hypothetical protein [Acidimicrobiales bacterium]